MATKISATVTRKAVADRNWEILAQEHPTVGLDAGARTEVEHCVNWRKWKAANPTSGVDPRPTTASQHQRNWRILYKEIA